VLSRRHAPVPFEAVEVFCPSRKLTTPTPCYAHGQEPVDAEEANSPSSLERPEGGAARAPSSREGPDLGHLQRDEAAAEPVLRLAVAALRERGRGVRCAEERASSREQELEAEIARLKEKLAKKDEVIAEVSEEFVKLKKALGEP
jgi:DNA gyrase/topoisomerase IV subunit A